MRGASALVSGVQKEGLLLGTLDESTLNSAFLLRDNKTQKQLSELWPSCHQASHLHLLNQGIWDHSAH